MAELTPGWLERAVRAGLAMQRQPAPPTDATTRASDGARMRKVSKAAAELSDTLRRRARAAQERVNALATPTGR
jgi:hypothetical protein